MAFQVLYKDQEGRDMLVLDPFPTEESAKFFLQVLNNAGLEGTLRPVEDKKWQLVKVVFDLQLVPAAKKAAKEGKDMYGMYTFGDPDKLGEIDRALNVECTDGRIKVAYVVGLWHATADEITEFKTKIGYKHLGVTKQKV